SGLDGVTGRDHSGVTAEARPRGSVSARGDINELLDITNGEERGFGVQFAGTGQRHLARSLRQPGVHPTPPTSRGAQHQPWVVLTHSVGSDKDGVDTGAQLVDPIEIGLARQQQSGVAVVVDVTVQRGSCGQQHVGPDPQRRAHPAEAHVVRASYAPKRSSNRSGSSSTASIRYWSVRTKPSSTMCSANSANGR